LLPHVKLKNTQTNFTNIGASTSGFSTMKKNLLDRITTKSNLHDHLKLTKGKPGGTKYGTFVEFEKEEKRSKSTINPKKTNR
jgi:hypothetical protein